MNFKEIKAFISSLDECDIISDGINILDKSIDPSNYEELYITRENSAITIKKHGEEYTLEEEKESEEQIKPCYSPFAEGDKNLRTDFADSLVEDAKLEELLSITVSDLLPLKEEDIKSKYSPLEEDGFLYFQRVPSMIFEAMDITRVSFKADRIIECDIMMILKENLNRDDKANILSIINDVVTNTLEVPGDEEKDSYSWNGKNYAIKAYIKRVKNREYAVLSYKRS